MPATLQRLLAHQEFGLRRLHTGSAAKEAIAWVSSTDLLDPSYFLSERLVIITSGQQFRTDDEDAVFDAYVDRLADCGVLGIGFGTDVFRHGTPEGLVTACARADLTLFEIPYSLPFLAIIRWVADILARESLAREQATIAAHQAVATAAISKAGGYESALSELAERLDGEVTVFDEDAEPRLRFPRRASAPPSVRSECRRLLADNNRAAITLHDDDGVIALHTLGGRGALRGAVAFRRSTALSRDEGTVLIAAIALTEVGLREEAAARERESAIRDAVLSLLLDREPEAASALARAAAVDLPREPVQVLRLQNPSGERAVREVDRRLSATAGWFSAQTPTGRVCLFPTSALRRVRDAFESARIPAGISEPVGYDSLHRGLSQAGLAAVRAASGPALWTGEPGDGMWELIAAPAARAIAEARLAAISADEQLRLGLDYARVWFELNCRWDPAAAALGVHRHTLRARVEAVASALDLDLDGFEGRAELWLVIRSSV